MPSHAVEPVRVTRPSLFDRSMPLLFVGIWATGFLVARLVAPHVDPLTFLSWRYLLSAAAFTAIAVWTRAPWPTDWRGWRNAAVTGVLLQAVYLGGVFWSVRHGLPAGISALLAGLQPLLTALLAFPLLGETVGRRRWIGIGLGFAGALLILAPRWQAGVGEVALAPLAAGLLAMLGITLGTLWQKRTGAQGSLVTSAAIQFSVSLLITAPVAAWVETGRFDMSWQAWTGLAWAVCGLSLGAISLLLTLIRRGSAAGVASLFYLVPPVVAILAWLLFDEQLTPLQMAGMAVVAVGVALASRAPSGQATTGR
jgi:drug/metabolite transporter (DMT)-like permease